MIDEAKERERFEKWYLSQNPKPRYTYPWNYIGYTQALDIWNVRYLSAWLTWLECAKQKEKELEKEREKVKAYFDELMYGTDKRNFERLTSCLTSPVGAGVV